MGHPTNSHYDIIIAGCGCSGLSLAWYLTEKTGDRFSILMIDKSFKDREKKTWCFWDEEYIPVPVQTTNSWSVLRFGSNLLDRSERMREYRYLCVDSHSYEESIMKSLSHYDHIRWLETEIQDYHENKSGVIVETDAGRFTGEKLFQSISPAGDVEEKEKLKQHFIGWEVKTGDVQFDKDVATLMDFSVDQKEATAFMYVLPFSANRALVEYTVFSDNLLDKREYEREIETYLEKKYSLSKGDYELIAEEKGAIPMIEKGYLFKSGEFVYNIGMVSGCSKPTTGYTFSRIHRMSKKIAGQLADGLESDIKKISPGRFRFYDILLLNILRENPGASTKIFSELFRRNSMDSILTFLDEKTGLREDVKLLISLPWSPFLKALWQLKWKLIKGDF